MKESRTKHKQLLFTTLATIIMVILLSSALLDPSLSVYAEKGNDKSEDNTNNLSHGPNNNQSHGHNNNQSHDDHEKHNHHKKGKKDPDKDKDNDRKACKHGDYKKNGKYHHNCDSDHDFKP